MKISITVDSKEVERALRELPKAAARALVSALNKTASRVETAASRKIRETYNVTASGFKKGITVHKSTMRNPETVIEAKG